MATKTFADVAVELTDDGYLTDSSQWTKEIGAEMAKEEGIEITDKHYEVIDFIRDKVSGGSALTIRSIGKSGVIDIKGFYQLFPGAPLKKATKVSGVAKPSSCI